jgi:hypothetical protein
MIAGLPTYGYRRMHALVRRRRREDGRRALAVNVKPSTRVVKRAAAIAPSARPETAVRLHDCRVAVERPDTPLQIDRDRGTPRGATPPPPPGIRVRTTAVRPG